MTIMAISLRGISTYALLSNWFYCNPSPCLYMSSKVYQIRYQNNPKSGCILVEINWAQSNQPVAKLLVLKVFDFCMVFCWQDTGTFSRIFQFDISFVLFCSVITWRLPHARNVLFCTVITSREECSVLHCDHLARGTFCFALWSPHAFCTVITSREEYSFSHCDHLTRGMFCFALWSPRARNVLFCTVIISREKCSVLHCDHLARGMFCFTLWSSHARNVLFCTVITSREEYSVLHCDHLTRGMFCFALWSTRARNVLFYTVIIAREEGGAGRFASCLFLRPHFWLHYTLPLGVGGRLQSLLQHLSYCVSSASELCL